MATTVQFVQIGRMKLLLFLLPILISPPARLAAQGESPGASRGSSRFSFRLAAMLETNTIHGDIQDNSAYMHGVRAGLNPGFSVSGSVTVVDVIDVFRFSLGVRAGYHFISTTVDSLLSMVPSNLELTDHIVDAALIGEVDFLDLELVRPFLNFGIGYMLFQPRIETSEAVRKRYSYVLDNPDRSGVQFPVGFGLKYTPVPRIEVSVQFQKIFTLTDNLDGWTSGKNDNIAIVGVGIAYTFGFSKPVMVQTIEEELRLKGTDTDGDGLSDWDEMHRYRTDYTNADTDEDGLTDGDEILKYFTDPLSEDTDGDELSDGDEVSLYKTDPQRKDTDRDGCDDGTEVRSMKTDPLRPDTDGDGLSDCDEVTIYFTNPLNVDSDNDGVSDGLEVQKRTDPTRPNK